MNHSNLFGNDNYDDLESNWKEKMGDDWRNREVLDAIFEINKKEMMEKELENIPKEEDLKIGNDVVIDYEDKLYFGAIVDIIKAYELAPLSNILKYSEGYEFLNCMECSCPMEIDRLIVEISPNRYMKIPIILENLKKIKVVRKVVGCDCK